MLPLLILSALGSLRKMFETAIKDDFIVFGIRLILC